MDKLPVNSQTWVKFIKLFAKEQISQVLATIMFGLAISKVVCVVDLSKWTTGLAIAGVVVISVISIASLVCCMYRRGRCPFIRGPDRPNHQTDALLGQLGIIVR